MNLFEDQPIATELLKKQKSFLQRLWEAMIPAPELTPQQVKRKVVNRKKAKVVKASRKKNRRKK